MSSFNVAQFLKERIGTIREFEIKGDSCWVTEEVEAKNIRGLIKMTRIGGGIFVTGDLQATVELQCARCLELAEIGIDFPLEDEYRPLVDIETGLFLKEPTPEEGVFPIDERHNLDLEFSYRQGILLALPMQPLCSVDCAGLCDQCGKNLNIDNCECQPVGVDTRLEVLKQLLKN